MKFFLFLTTLFFNSSLAAYADIEYRDNIQTFIFQEQKNDIINLLVAIDKNTKIRITAADNVTGEIYFPEKKVTLHQALRAIDSQYSTIKGFNSSGELVSVGVIPLGSPLSSESLKSVQELSEYINQTSERTRRIDKPESQIPPHIDPDNIQESDWNNLSEEQKSALRKLNFDKVRARKDQKNKERKKTEDMEFLAHIESIKNSDPELYQIMKKRYKRRLEQAAEHIREENTGN